MLMVNDFIFAQYQTYSENIGKNIHDSYCLTGSEIKIDTRGNSVANRSPMLCFPSHHSYIVNIESNAMGGLVLFYQEKFYSEIIADFRGWQFPGDSNHTVFMYNSFDGKKGVKLKNYSMQKVCIIMF